MTYENGERIQLLDEVIAEVTGDIFLIGKVVGFDKINGRDYVIVGHVLADGSYRNSFASRNAVKQYAANTKAD